MSNTTITTTPPQFRTVCRLGRWIRVDAMWNINNDEPGLTSNYVHFGLVDGYGYTVQVGYSIITTDDTGFVVTDEDGEQFPDLETAIRRHAERLLTLDWQWTNWQDSPPSHRSKVGNDTIEIAFAARDIAFAMQLASGDLYEREGTLPGKPSDVGA